jgi:HK97 family phage major capsid protein
MPFFDHKRSDYRGVHNPASSNDLAPELVEHVRSLSDPAQIDSAINALRDGVSEVRRVARNVERRALNSAETTELEQREATIRLLEERRDTLVGFEKRAGDLRDAQSAADAAFRSLSASPAAGNAEQRDGHVDDGRQVADEFRSALLENNPKPIVVRSANPRSYYQPGVEQRDLLKTGPANFQRVSFYDKIVEHMVETSAVLRAGATLVNTDTGEDLRIPRSTALGTASLVAEAAAIPEADPTLGVVTLGAYKYGVLIQVSREMADDTSVDLVSYLARQAGTAIGNAIGDRFINGTGTGQPTGVLQGATTGITGPTGTATSFGSQQTAGQGTDLLNGLVGSLAEPYTQSKAAGFLLRTATLTSIRNLKASTGELVGNSYLASSPYPFMVDPFVPAMGANAKSVIFGDWSRYYVRMVNGIRFERSDDYAFANDMVTFRALIRVDGNLIDPTGAIKVFAHSAT